MKKPKERTRITDVPLYNHCVLEVVFTKDMHASSKSRGLEDDAAARTFGNGSNVVIMLPWNCKASLIAHEAVHAATYILMQAGVRASLSNDEPIAYLVDWITDWIIKQVPRTS